MQLGTLGSLAISLQGNLAQLEQDLSKSQYMVRQAMGGVNSIIGKSALNFEAFGKSAREALNFGDVARQIASIAIPSASVAGLVEMVKSSVEAQAHLQDMATATGIGARQLAGLDYAAKQSGTSMDALSLGVSRLSRFIGDANTGNKIAAQTLQALGVTAKNPLQAFEQLAGAIKNIKDPTERASLLTKTLGRDYIELAPLLMEGAKGVQALVDKGQQLSGITDTSAAQAKEFDDRLTDLKAMIEGNVTSIVNGMLPTLTDIASAFQTSGAAADKANASYAPLGDFLRGAAVVGVNVAYVFDEIGKEIGGMASQVNALAHFDFSQAAAIHKMMMQDAAESRKYIDDLNKRLMSPRPVSIQPKAEGGGTDNSVSIAKKLCESQGGKWDGTTCQPRQMVSDPAASLRKLDESLRQQTATFDQGSVAVMKYRLSLGDLAKTVHDAGRGGKSLAADILARSQALEDMRQKQKSAAFDAEVAANDAQVINDSIKQREDYNATIKQLADNWRNTIDPLKQYRDQLAEIQRLAGEKGGLSAGDAAKATAYVQKQMQAVTDGTKKTYDAARQLGLTFQSAFEDAVVGGKSFRQVLQGMEQDIEKIILRKMVTEPLANSITGMFSGSPYAGAASGGGGFSWASLIPAAMSMFGFANGGIMTGRGPVSLRKYAGGGIATGPQFAMYGEGSSAEAYVPLPDGRSIPVTMQGGQGSGPVTVNIVEAPGRGGQMQQSQSGNGGQMLTVWVEQIKSSLASDVARGKGAFPASLQQTYGLNRVAGAH